MADDRGNVQVDVELNPSKAIGQADDVGKQLGSRISESVSKATDTASDSVNKSLESIGGQMESFGKGYSKAVTLPITAVAVAAGAAAVDIDTSLTGVRKTVDGTEEDYQRLKDAAIEFSKTNAVEASQILDIQALGAQLGYDIDQLDLFSQTISSLDIATDLDAESGAKAIAQMSNIMGSAKDEVDRYGSAIVDLGNNYATTESSITNMALRIAGAGKQIGLSEADVLGLSTALSSMGIEAEAGGTAISTIMSSIDKSVALNDKNLKTWAETAKMSTADFKKAWQDNAVDALSAVLVGMDEATQSGGNMSVMLDELGINSIRQTDVLKRLASNSEYLGDAVGTANKAWEENVALSNEVENFNSSMSGQLEQLKNKATAIATELGEPLMNALLDIISSAEPFVQALASGAKAFGDLDEGAQKAILMAVGVVAAFGPLTTIGGKVVTMLSTQGNKWKEFGNNMKAVWTGLKTAQKNTVSATAAVSKNTDTTKKAATASKAAATETKGLTAATKAQGIAATETAAKTKASTVAMNLARGAANALKGALLTIAPIAIITAAVELFGMLSDAIQTSKEKADDHKKATEGIAGVMDSYNKAFNDSRTSMENAAKGNERYVSSISDVRDAVDDAIKKTAELSDTLNESFSETGTNNAMVDNYADSIKTLTSKYDEFGNKQRLSATEQGELINAVEGLNKIMGTTYKVIDAQNGILDTNTDEILKSADAWKKRALMEAQSSAAADIMKRKVENTTALSKAEDVLKTTQERLDQAVRNGETDLTHYKLGVEDAQKEVDRLKGVQEGLEKEQEDLNTSVAKLNNELNSSVDSLKDYVDGSKAWSNAVEKNNIDSDEFMQKLSDMGVSTEDMALVLKKSGKEGVNEFIDAYQKGGDTLTTYLRDEFGIDLQNASHDAAALTGDGFMAGLNEAETRIVNAVNGVVGITNEQFAKLAQGAGISGEDAMGALAVALADGTVNAESSADEVKSAVQSKLDEMDGSYPASKAIHDMQAALSAGEGNIEAAAKGDAKAAQKGLDSTDGKTPGKKASSDFGVGIFAGKREADAQAMAVGDSAAANMKDTNGQARTSGQNLVQGFINGMGSMLSNVINKAAELTNGALDTIRKIGKENSPWKTTIQSGKYAAQGLAVGMEKSKKYVKKSAADLSQAIVDAAEKRLSKLKRTRDISIGYEVAYWKEIAKHTKKGTKARSEAVQKRKEAVKKANDELLKAEKTFKSEVTKIQDNLAKETNKAWDTYYQAVESRKNAILGSFNLFDRFRVNSQRSSEVLLENLRTQTEAAEEYKSAMDTLRSKIGEGALYQEIADMGVDALGQIRSLNAMSDAELKEYMDLFNRRNEAAKQEAVRENQSLYNETVNTVKKLTDDANKEIKKAASTLAKTAAKLGTSTASSVKKMANSIAKSSKSIIDSVNASIKAIEKLNKKTTTKKSTSKKSTSKTKAVSAMSLEAVPVTYSYDANGTANGIARTLGAGYMSQVEDSITKGLAAMTLTATSGNNYTSKEYNQTITFNQPVQSPDEIARTMRMQQRYGLAGEY